MPVPRQRRYIFMCMKGAYFINSYMFNMLNIKIEIFLKHEEKCYELHS